ncbi:MAG: DoxX family protein [Gammaproteobacteria bacterium]|nr:DoxX family protein [Gammaproteobacteria bacterium]
MKKLLSTACGIAKVVTPRLDQLAPVADLLIRVMAAKFFWDSALTKLTLNWELPFIHMNPSTLILFQYEYQVPLLPSSVAAYMGSGVELIFPVLLAIGLAGRLSAFVLFGFNIVAVLSYPGLNAAGQFQHLLYGVMLLLPLFRGPGLISVDHLLKQRCN